MSFLSGLFGRAARPATAPAPTPATGAARDVYERGVAALASGDAAAGIDHLEAALALRQPEDDFLADALARLARALHDTGRHADALRRAEQRASIEPSPAASLQVAQELHCCGRAQDAMQVVSQVLSADPRNLDAMRGRAMILLQLGRAPEALDAWNDVIAAAGETPMSLTQRAVALQRLGRVDEALRDTDAALRLDPQDRGALVNRVAQLTELLRLDDAKKAAQDALGTWPELPELHLNLSIVHMLLGELEPGWVEREWRWKIPNRATQARWAGPRWRGEDLAGRTLLLFAEQGFGDTIHFARYVPMLAARAKEVLLAVPRELESLLSDLAPNSRVLHEGDAMPAYDFQCPFLSVPGVVGTPTADAIPAPQRYLRAPADAVEAWKLRLGDAGGRRTVGLVWSGNPEHTNDRNRSLPLQMLRELAETGCRFVSLQPQVRAGDEAPYRAWPGLLRFGEDVRDFADTAALVSALDLVITVDTSVAHLAGALGVPTWILLPYSPDWRWMTGREDSPWYPGARLLRQPSIGNWQAVVDRVRSDLAQPVLPVAQRTQATAPEWIAQGNTALQKWDLPRAAECYRQATRLEPANAVAHLNAGFVALEQGDASAAAQHLTRAASLARADAALAPDAHFLLGRAQRRLGDVDAALAAFDAALAARADFAEALEERATLLLEADRPAEARDAARAWAGRAPQSWMPPFVEGQSLESLGRHDEAIAAFDRALQLSPAQAQPLQERGNSLFRLARFEDAARSFEAAAAAAPQWADPWAHRCAALDRLHRYDEALACADAALQRDPTHRLALYVRAMLLMFTHREEEALAALQRARDVYPDDAKVEWDYGFGHLLAGRMAQGWPAFEARWRTRDIGVALKRPSFDRPLWTGQPIDGKTLLLYPEQGYGDVLQFIRFVPALERAGARVLVWAPEPLADLVATVSPRCIVGTSPAALPPFDFHSPIMSVPLHLGTTLETLPAHVPYLSADARLRREWAQRLGDKRGLRVGVVWSGNPAQKNDHNRSIPLELFSTLETPGCEFVSLLNGVQPRDEAALRAWKGLRHFGPEIRTFADTAALAQEMDLVVTVCTSGAHLAGALGLPMWVLLAYRADWRWLLHREDSPWYPTARLFRQGGDCDWRPVLERVRAELAGRVRDRASA